MGHSIHVSAGSEVATKRRSSHWGRLTCLVHLRAKRRHMQHTPAAVRSSAEAPYEPAITIVSASWRSSSRYGLAMTPSKPYSEYAPMIGSVE
jgi:hypothetical protein